MNILKSIKNIKKIVKQSESFLENGKYFFNSNFTQLIQENLTNEINNTFDLTNRSIKKIIFNIIIKCFIKKEVYILSERTEFSGNQLLITSNGYGIKIFNKNEILTIFENNADKNVIAENKSKMSKIFYVPNTIRMEEKYIVEERIKNFAIDKEFGLIYILNSYINFFKNCNVKIFEKDNHDNNFLKLANSRSEKKISIIQHGDLWFGNVLYDNKKIYIIDFENVENKYFLYDIFLYMYSEVYMNKDFKLLDNYFNGKYNKYLEEYFNALDLVFKDNLKAQYFIDFIYDFFEERFSKYTNLRKKKEINNIKRDLKKYNIIKEG